MSETIDLGPDIRQFDGDRLRVDMIVAAAPFQGLLRRCVGVYLDDSQRYDERLDGQAAGPAPQAYGRIAGDGQVTPGLDDAAPIDPGETALIRELGIGGYNAAMVTKILGPQAGEIDYQWLDAAMRRPDLFTQPADPEVGRRMAAFGKAYMEAMYRAMGIAAPAPGAELDADGQLDALHAVFDAIHTLGNEPGALALPFSGEQIASMLADEDQYGRPHYDPLLMSAKVYPNNQNIRPSCAAQMAMVAGFCEAAGWPHMTASTLMDTESYIMRCLGRSTYATIDLLNDNGLPAHPLDNQAIAKTTKAVEEYTARDDGFHGCNLVRFDDGLWRQVDMTRGIFEAYNELQSARLDTYYDSLQIGRRANLPGAMMFGSFNVLSSFEHISAAAADAATRLLDRDGISRQLRYLKLNRQLTIDHVVDRLLLPVVLPDDGEFEHTDYGQLITQIFPEVVGAASRGKDFVRQVLRELVVKQAFIPMARDSMPGFVRPHRALHGNRPCDDNCLKQTVQDSDRGRVLTMWLQSAPVMFYQKLANDYTKYSLDPEHKPAHPSLEISSPAIHLAATVLSADNAYYSGESGRLPAAWWPTYDPTHYGHVIHMYEATGTGSLGQLVNGLQLLRHLPQDSLLQASKAARIEGFLGRNR